MHDGRERRKVMSIPRHIRDFLQSRNVHYQHKTHAQEFTAARTAEAQHVSGQELAKSVMVMAEERPVMAVIPANERLDLQKLSHLLGASSVRLATEGEFERLFPGCELGAEPPLGSLYDIPVWLDVSFEDHDVIVFNAGTHQDTIEMSLEDFEELEQPKIGRLAELD
jgi:Ala-tRNA(Pro) deacylase